MSYVLVVTPIKGHDNDHKSCLQSMAPLDNYPVCMRRGKVMSLSVRLSVVTTKVARSRHLGT